MSCLGHPEACRTILVGPDVLPQGEFGRSYSKATGRYKLTLSPAHGQVARAPSRDPKGWRNSRHRSSVSLIPTEIRIVPAEIPWRASCSSLLGTSVRLEAAG
jgi:hypothetical protein